MNAVARYTMSLVRGKVFWTPVLENDGEKPKLVRENGCVFTPADLAGLKKKTVRISEDANTVHSWF